MVVYVSAGGDVYHFDPNCYALAYGQELVRERGGTPAPIVSTYEHIAKEERGFDEARYIPMENLVHCTLRDLCEAIDPHECEESA